MGTRLEATEQSNHRTQRNDIQSENAKAAGKMGISVDSEAKYAKSGLNLGAITFGEKDRKKMKNSHLRKQENANISLAVCALSNSGGGAIKVKIENENYSLTRDGSGLDLEASLCKCSPFVQWHSDFTESEGYIYIYVKSWSQEIFGSPIGTLRTNLYVRSMSSSVQVSAAAASEFLQDSEETGGRPCVRPELPASIAFPEVEGEWHSEDLAAALFNRTEFQYEETFPFTRSRYVEVTLLSAKRSRKRIKELLPQTVSAFANTDGGFLFIGLDGKTQQIIGFEAEKSDLVLLESEIEKHIRQSPVTHFCEEKEKIKYTCKFIEVHKSGAVCAYVCAIRVEKFCCAVFAAEPESWHVEGSCVKRFTTEEWVKRQMDATAVMPGKVICSPEALCMKPFSQHEGYEQLVRTELGSSRKGTSVVSKSWALDSGLQEKQEVIWDVLHISQGSLSTSHVFVQGDENSEGNSSLLGKLGAELKGYYKQIALTLKQTLVNHCGYTAKIGIIVKITYLGHKTMCLYDSSAKICYPQIYYSTTKAVKDLEKALAEILGSYESFYSLPRRNWDSFMSAFLNVGSYIVYFSRNVLTHIRI